MANDFADLSSNNFRLGQTMDVPAYVRSGRKYIMLKSSEGVGYHWGYGDTIQSAMHGQGAVVGRYHWLRPDADPTQQADYFVSVTQPNLRAGDDLMADLETTYDNGVPLNDGSDAQQAARFIAWANQVKAKLPGYPLRVYTGNWYLDGKPQLIAAIKPYQVFLSDYNPTVPDIGINNKYGLNLYVRQFTDKAAFDGIPGTADGNRFLVSDAHMPAGDSGTVITPPANPKVADMSQAFLVPGKKPDGTASGRWWIVAIDHSTRVQTLDVSNAQALSGKITDGLPYIDATMTYGEMQQIPDVTYHNSATTPAGS